MQLARKFICLALTTSLAACATARVEDREVVNNSANLAAQKLTLPDSTEQRKPIKKGQWVTLLIESLRRDQDLILRTIKILDVTGNTVRIEIDSQSALAGGKMQTEGYVIDHYPLQPIFEYTRRQLQAATNSMVFRRIIIKEPDKEQEDWAQELLVFNQSAVAKILMSGYVPDEAKMEPTPCSSGPIDSKRCLMFPHRLDLLDHSTHGRTHGHSEVPIVGFLHSADENFTYKVIAFGEDGAVGRLSY